MGRAATHRPASNPLLQVTTPRRKKRTIKNRSGPTQASGVTTLATAWHTPGGTPATPFTQTRCSAFLPGDRRIPLPDRYQAVEDQERLQHQNLCWLPGAGEASMPTFALSGYRHGGDARPVGRAID